MSELCHVSVEVYGKVQGVFYRAYTSRIAKSLSLKGYVRNLPRSNSVEVQAEGYKDKVEQFVKQLEIGPPESLVENVEVKWSNYTGEYIGFEIR
jgi:acylphosphatase